MAVGLPLGSRQIVVYMLAMLASRRLRSDILDIRAFVLHGWVMYHWKHCYALSAVAVFCR